MSVIFISKLHIKMVTIFDKESGTELFPCEILAKINFDVIRDTSKSLRHGVTTIIISTFYEK